MPSATRSELAHPWRASLVDVDRQLPRPIAIHCLGGFVAALYYDLPRPTNDLDYIEMVPHDAMAALQEIAALSHRSPGNIASIFSTWPSPVSRSRMRTV